MKQELLKEYEGIQNRLKELPKEYLSTINQDDYNLVIGNSLVNRLYDGPSFEKINQTIGGNRSENALHKPIKNNIDKIIILDSSDLLKYRDVSVEDKVREFYSTQGLNPEVKLIDDTILSDAFGYRGSFIPEHIKEKQDLAHNKLLKEFDKEYVEFAGFSNSSPFYSGYGVATKIADLLKDHGKVSKIYIARQVDLITPVGESVEYN